MTKAAETVVEVQEKLADYFMDASLTQQKAIPEELRERLRLFAKRGMSPVDAAVQLAELAYARADELPVEVLAIAAEASAIIDEHNFHGMRENGRAKGIGAELRKRPGVKPAAPAQSAKPEPLERFKKGSADPVAPATPAPPPTG